MLWEGEFEMVTPSIKQSALALASASLLFNRHHCHHRPHTWCQWGGRCSAHSRWLVVVQNSGEVANLQTASRDQISCHQISSDQISHEQKSFEQHHVTKYPVTKNHMTKYPLNKVSKRPKTCDQIFIWQNIQRLNVYPKFNDNVHSWKKHLILSPSLSFLCSLFPPLFIVP